MNGSSPLSPVPLPLHQGFMALLCLVVSACASNIPEQIRLAPPADISPAEARQQADTFSGQRVRWGGQIIAIENKPDYTEIIILSRPLDKHGEPLASTRTDGRFIARVAQFLEPSVYTVGRNITVVGSYTQTEQRMIGEYPYLYPLVHADYLHLWPIPVEPDPDYWYDPWYPWGPWGPWHPWHHHYH